MLLHLCWAQGPYREGIHVFMSLNLFLWKMRRVPNSPALMLAANCCTPPQTPTLIQPLGARTSALGALISLPNLVAGPPRPWTLPQS